MQSRAVLGDLRGGSRHRLACRRRGAAQAGRPWSRALAPPSPAPPDPPGRTSGLAREARDPGQRLAWDGGRRDQQPRHTRVARLAPGDVIVYGTAPWATSAAGRPPAQGVPSQAPTQASERQQSRQLRVAQGLDAGMVHQGGYLVYIVEREAHHMGFFQDN